MIPPREPDATLVARLGFDPDALDVFYRRHVGAVTAFAARRCGGADDVADVVSQTFMRAIAGSTGFDARRTRAGAGDARGWLLRIALNVIRDGQRRERRERAASDLEAGRRLLDDDSAARLDALVESLRVAPAVRRALDGLSPAERDALVLVTFDGLTTREAAVVLGITPLALRARVSRARRRLRLRLGPELASRPTVVVIDPKEAPCP